MIKQTKRIKKIYERFSRSRRARKRKEIESIHALVNLVEKKDPYTKRHSVKVSKYAAALAKKIKLSEKKIERIRLAGILHDVGKIAVRQKVLLKKGKLTEKEYEEVKKHPEIGADMLKPFKFLKFVVRIIRHHHENYDGSGYPGGLRKNKIPVASRIISIADAYDALTSKRAYRKAFSSEKAKDIMYSERNTKFDPELLDRFMECLADIFEKIDYV